jgi:N utilization substance protein B
MNNKISFAERKRARRYALQALYGWIFSQNATGEIEAFVFEEHHDAIFDKEYFSVLLHNIPKKIHELDTIMSPYLSRPLEDLGPIELTILRIAVYELKERLDIPYKVVINEGLELAKAFASPDSHKFVNGVLDKVAKVIRPENV